MTYDKNVLVEKRTMYRPIYECGSCHTRLVPCVGFQDCRGLACAAKNPVGFDEQFCNWCGGAGGELVLRWCSWCKTNGAHKELDVGLLGTLYFCTTCKEPTKACLLCSEAMAKATPPDDMPADAGKPDPKVLKILADEKEKHGDGATQMCHVCAGIYVKWDTTLQTPEEAATAPKPAPEEKPKSASKPVMRDANEEFANALNTPAPDISALPTGRSRVNAASSDGGCMIL